MANHFRTDEQQESSFDDRFGVISQDDLNQLDQQDVVADQVETQDFSADVPVAQLRYVPSLMRHVQRCRLRNRCRTNLQAAYS